MSKLHFTLTALLLGASAAAPAAELFQEYVYGRASAAEAFTAQSMAEGYMEDDVQRLTAVCTSRNGTASVLAYGTSCVDDFEGSTTCEASGWLTCSETPSDEPSDPEGPQGPERE